MKLRCLTLFLANKRSQANSHKCPAEPPESFERLEPFGFITV